MEMDNRLSPSIDSENGDVQNEVVVWWFTDAAGLRWSGRRSSGHGACAEQNDEDRNARKRAYCLTVATR